jgi:hypothetical protein
MRCVEVAVAVRRLAGIAAAASCLLLGLGATAVASSTVPFEGSYRAYNLWDGWKSSEADKCTKIQPIYGSEPAIAGRYPVVLYMHGTLADWGGNAEGRRFVEFAAAQGFVAAAFTYGLVAPTQASIDGHAKCMFGSGSPGNGLAYVCARAKADCTNGVAVAGFSAGGAMAVRAKNFSAQVRAAWVIGVHAPAPAAALAEPVGTRALPNDRLRINVGRSDVEVKDPATGRVAGVDLTALNQLTGMSCPASPCLRPDGSGYYVVQHTEVADGVADHCYWQRVNMLVPTNSCTWNPTFDPGFPPPSTTPWSLIAGLTWLRTKLG